MTTSYKGKLLRVDLDSGKLSDEPLNMDYAHSFIGGSGLAARYIYDLVKEDTAPLSGENPLVIMTGALTGTNAPCCGRFTICARSPLTGFWGESNCGGDFGPRLKFAGYDGIIITGRSDKPVYLEINRGQTRLLSAQHLWGQDTKETQESIKKDWGRKKISIACIGPAGENLNKTACVIINNGRAAGRTGMGAVFGSKNLKAIVVAGDSKPTPLDKTSFAKAVREAHQSLSENITAQMLNLGGTAFYMDIGMMYGDVPVKYYTKGEFDVSNVTGATIAETILTKKTSCYQCPIFCGRQTKLERYGVTESHGPEYETLVALGPLLEIDDLSGIAYAGHLCNLYGMDTISTGATIAFATHLYQKGILTTRDTQGLELKWGDIDTVISIIKMIAHREGFGAILADGSLAMAKHYGKEEEAVHVKGLEMAMHDPRSFSGMAVTYATSPRGACHLHSDCYMVEIGAEVPELGISSSLREEWGQSNKAKVEMAARHQNWRSIYDAIILCKFSDLPPQIIADLINSATGLTETPQTLIDIGERIFNLKRLLNLRFGLTPKDDQLPKLILTSLPDGGTEGNVPNIKKMLGYYYDFRQWNNSSGKISVEKLDKLGLKGL
jgi:aldehyde:ferredoxin oxidoreductase